ncbi:hypothetical protein [Phaeobacter inhibens]|uniref:hypothetical protein n=1 Tax=Phaeobacter inhibens TaxID=221822 RepID=UPI0012EC28F7|nr:hypothetical protein [Phaeobacter inhibens]
MTAEFQQVDGFHDLYVGRSNKFSCTAFRMRDGSLCLYSPVAGLETAFARHQSELGEVTALLAPNHYHNKGLSAHIEVFPNATLYCSSAAQPRLSKVTGLTFSTLNRLRERLPAGSDLHEPAGLKSGEVWLQVKSNMDCALAVTDAFNSALLPSGSYADCVSLLGTFPRYGVKDAGSYKIWATEFLTATAPSILLPCHGSPVKSADLITQLIGLVEKEI